MWMMACPQRHCRLQGLGVVRETRGGKMLCSQRALSSCEACSRGQAQLLARLPTVQQVCISLRFHIQLLPLLICLPKCLMSLLCSLMPASCGLCCIPPYLHLAVVCTTNDTRSTGYDAQLSIPDILVPLQRSCRVGLTVVNMKKDIHPKFYEEAKVGPSNTITRRSERGVCKY